MPYVASLSITLLLRHASSTMEFTNTHFNVLGLTRQVFFSNIPHQKQMLKLTAVTKLSVPFHLVILSATCASTFVNPLTIKQVQYLTINDSRVCLSWTLRPTAQRCVTIYCMLRLTCKNRIYFIRGFCLILSYQMILYKCPFIAVFTFHVLVCLGLMSLLNI